MTTKKARTRKPSKAAQDAAWRKACTTGPNSPEARKRDAELREMARQRNEAYRPNPETRALAAKINAAGGRDKATKRDLKRFDELMERPDPGERGLPLWLHNETEAETVRRYQAELTSESLARSIEKLITAQGEATEAQRMLANALAEWVKIRMKAAYKGNLNDDENRLLALLITPTGNRLIDGEKKYMTYAKIGKGLGVSRMAAYRRETKLREDHPAIDEWLKKNTTERKSRGVPKKHRDKNKKMR